MNEKNALLATLIRVWEADIQNCSNLFGTGADYVNAVCRFYFDIPNVRGIADLRNIIDKYIDNDLEQYKDNQLSAWYSEHPNDARDIAIRKKTESDIEEKASQRLFTFMLQLLVDNSLYSGDTLTGES